MAVVIEKYGATSSASDDVKAPFDGIIIGHSKLPLAHEGDALFHVAAFKSVARAEGRVEEIAYLGDVSVYHIRVAGGALIEAQLTNRARRAAAPLTWGDQAWVGWDADDALALLE